MTLSYSDTGIDSNIHQYVAKWILKTRECGALSKSAMQGIIEGTQELLNFAPLSIKAQIYAKLQEIGVNSNDKNV